MIENINRGAPRVSPGSTSLAAAAAEIRGSNRSDFDHLSGAFAEVETLVLTFNTAQLLDHPDDAENVQLACDMLILIVNRVRTLRAEIDQRLDACGAARSALVPA